MGLRLMSMMLLIVVWATSPVLKRRVLDYMSLQDELEIQSPVRTFVMVNSAVCTFVAALVAYPTGPRQFIDQLPAEGWFVLVAGGVLAVAGGVLLASLLSTGNPGETIVYLNAGTNVLSYVIGCILYGELTWIGTSGVFLIVAGATLLKD